MYPRLQYVNHIASIFEKYNPPIFHQQIRLQLHEHYAPLINELDIDYVKRSVQIGGKKKDLETTQEFHGYVFRVNMEKTKDDIYINVLTHHKGDTTSCANITINKHMKLAYINNVSYYPGCAYPVQPGLPENPTGSIILKFTLSLLKNNKTSFGINRIVLKDNSLKRCHNCPNKVRLSNMYFLLYGDTWYGQYGFRPFDMADYKPDEDQIAEYIKTQKTIRKTLVKDVSLLKYIIDGSKKVGLKVDIKGITKFVNESKNVKLSELLVNLMSDYDKNCCLFEYMQTKIWNELRLYPFHGSSFYLDI